MSRVNYNDDNWDENAQRRSNLRSGRWKRQRRSKRGQAFFREMQDVLLALPDKRLAGNKLVDDNGCGCAGGELVIARKMATGMTRGEAILSMLGDVEEIDSGGLDMVDFLDDIGIQRTVAWMMVHENDGGYCEVKMTPEGRYDHVLAWTRSMMLETS